MTVNVNFTRMLTNLCDFLPRYHSAAVSFGDGIVSSDTVGYQKLTVVGGGVTWAISTLKQMDNTLANQTLGSFVIPTDAGFVSGDTLVLEIYDETGSLEGAYSFVDEGNAALYNLTNPG